MRKLCSMHFKEMKIVQCCQFVSISFPTLNSNNNNRYAVFPHLTICTWNDKRDDKWAVQTITNVAFRSVLLLFQFKFLHISSFIIIHFNFKGPVYWEMQRIYITADGSNQVQSKSDETGHKKWLDRRLTDFFFHSLTTWRLPWNKTWICQLNSLWDAIIFFSEESNLQKNEMNVL